MKIFFKIFILMCVLGFFSIASHGQASDTIPPQYDAVMAIMEPLEYSGIHNIIDKDAQLNVDFNKRTWTLFNKARSDDDGSDILIDGKKGLCVRLARYVYHQIKPMFPDESYEIYFEKAKEKDFFFAPRAIHFLLTVRDRHSNVKYLIDPSFKRYGRLENFDQYVFFDHLVPEEFLRSNRSSEKYFNIDSASPLFIRDGHLILFSVESIEGKADINHFVLSISAVKKQVASGDYLLGLRFINGYVQTYSNEELMRRLLKPEEITKLQKRLLYWCMIISGNQDF